MLREHLTTFVAAAVPGQRVATAGLDVVALVELAIVLVVAITNWFYKRKKDKEESK